MTAPVFDACDRPDFTLWHALHSTCPPGGCGGCVEVDLDVNDDTWDRLTRAAQIVGEEIDVFLHRAIREGLKK